MTRTHSIFALKSWLFTPGTMVNRFGRAAEVHADALIIDLEDSVARPSKTEAREAAIKYLANIPEDHLPCALRINPPNTKTGLEDLQALLGSVAAPRYLVLPKCDSPGTIGLVDALLKEAGKSTEIIAVIESARSVSALEDMAGHPSRPSAFLFGAADMAASLGAELAWESLLFTRSRIVQVASLAAIAALDSPFFDVSDTIGLRQETRASANLGFHGKCAIHPGQVQIINEIFMPTQEQIKHALEVLAVNRQGVGSVGHSMVDEAFARKARLLLTRAGRDAG